MLEQVMEMNSFDSRPHFISKKRKRWLILF